MAKKRKKAEDTTIPDRTDARVGSVAVSMAGHDAGLVVVIIAGVDEKFVLIADGKTRKILSPKKKKMQHLSILTRLSEEDAAKLREGRCNDSFLRRAIAAIDLESYLS